MKPFLCLLCVFCIVTVNAQIKLGIFAGPQISTAHYDVHNSPQSVNSKYGFQLGATFKVPFESVVYFAPALYYSQKGYNVTLKNNSVLPHPLATSNETRIHTVDVVPMLQLDFSPKPGHFFVKAGPSLEFNVSGKETYTKSTGETISQSMKFDYEVYSLATASAVVHLGYESAKGFFVFAHYAHGLGNLTNADNGPRILHRVGGLSLGWFFHRNPNVIDTRVRE